MLENRYTDTANDCTCAARSCVNKILAVLAIGLALIVGLIIGVTATATIVEALIPLEIFAIGLALAIVLIFFFGRCRCRTKD